MRWGTLAAGAMFLFTMVLSTIASEGTKKSSIVSKEAVKLKWAKEEIAGGGTKGPFVLSWSEIVPRSDRVYLLGRKLFPGHDYFVDYKAGVIIFANPLPKGEKCEVYYAYQPGLSHKKSEKRPLEVASHFLSPGLRLGVTLVPEKGGGRASRAALSLASEMTVGRSGRAATLIAISPEFGPSGASGLVPSEAYAIRSGWGTSLSKLDLRAEVERVGRRFRGPGKWSVKPGGERFSLLTEVPLFSAGRARLSLERVEQDRLERKRVGFEAISPLGRGLKAAFRREAVEMRGSKPEAERVIQEVKVEQSLGETTRAVLTLREEQAGEVEQEEKRLEISAAPSKGLTLRGGLRVAELNSGPTQEEKHLGAKLSKDGLSLEAALKEVEAGKTTEEIREVRARAEVGKSIEAALSLKEHEAPTGGTKRVRAASVNLFPSPKLRLSGEMVEAPSKAERAFRAEVRPSPSISLFASRILREEGEGTEEIGLSLKPLGVAMVEAKYAHFPVGEGKVLPEERYECGLLLPVGLGWRLEGRFVRRAELPTGRTERRMEISLLRPLGGERRLRLGLSLAERLEGSREVRGYELGLGYLHDFTSTFGLSLEGKMRRESSGGMLSKPYYQAEAKFRLLY